jgi:hypothetical protein
MRIFSLLFIVLFTVSSLAAQINYSFITDKKFQGTDELIGYSFRPNTIVYPDKKDPKDSQEVGLAPEDIVFRISKNYLLVETEMFENYKGAYSVNSINPADYGYKISLMNARNPSIQGHLKIILNKQSEVDAYIFKPSNKIEEVIFYQAEISKNIDKTETDYFTDITDIMITDTSLWYTTIYPFFELEQQQQRRLTPDDSVSIFFDVDTVVTNVKKNKKRLDYYIVLNYMATDEDGFKSMDKVVFLVDGKTNLRENTSGSGGSGTRYRVEFNVKTPKNTPIYIYLNKHKKVNNVILGNINYTMRGVD